MSDTQYFNFPVQILNGIFQDKEKVLCDILYCALYAHSLKLENESGWVQSIHPTNGILFH